MLEIEGQLKDRLVCSAIDWWQRICSLVDWVGQCHAYEANGQVWSCETHCDRFERSQIIAAVNDLLAMSVIDRCLRQEMLCLKSLDCIFFPTFQLLSSLVALTSRLWLKGENASGKGGC